MIFTEQKTTNGFYKYHTEDFCGVINLEANKKLAPRILDNCVLKISQNGLRSGTIKDEKNGIEVMFEFEPKPIWVEDLEEDNK